MGLEFDRVRAMQAQLAPHWCQAAVPPLCHDALAGCHRAEHMAEHVPMLHSTFWGTSVCLSSSVVPVPLPSAHGRLPQPGNACGNCLDLPFSDFGLVACIM